METSSSQEPSFSLPLETVFSIQIGTELFRLSGASIASDAPSYFSQFFEDQIRQNEGDASNVRTLYIDRDPWTFREIARHLQGYHSRPRDGTHFVRLFADAQFYSLPRLTSQLFESDIFIEIGGRHFQIPRDIFSAPGNSPNFFSLGFAAFFASPSQVFPGLDRRGLLRPPGIEPPSVPSRSGDVFAELLHLLRGYPLEIQSEEHRAQLLRDCRYFHLRGLEQKLIPHHISFNPISEASEIVIPLDDVRQSGIGNRIVEGEEPLKRSTLATYARPFTDDEPRDLIVETSGESMFLGRDFRHAKALGPARVKLANLLQVFLTKMNAPPIQARDRFSVHVDEHTDLTVDGETVRDMSQYKPGVDVGSLSSASPPSKRRRVEEPPDVDGEWIVRKGQWRLLVIPGELQGVLLHAVKLDIYAKENVRNRTRGFLC